MNLNDHTLMTLHIHNGRHKNIEREAAALGLAYVPLRENYFALVSKEFEQDGNYRYWIPKVRELRERVEKKKLPLLGPEVFGGFLANNAYFRNVIDRMIHLDYGLAAMEYRDNDDRLITLPRDDERYIRFNDAAPAFQPYSYVVKAQFNVFGGMIIFNKSGWVLMPDYIYTYERDGIIAAIKDGLCY